MALYGPAIVAAITRSVAAIRECGLAVDSMLAYLAGEAGHPEMARQAFLALGGSEEDSRDLQQSPAAFVVASVVTQLANTQSPFTYLGYIYLLEKSTAEIVGPVQAALRGRQLSIPFVEVHALEEVEHVRLVAKQISDVCTDDESRVAAIRFGFAALASVYPLAIWEQALAKS